MRKYRIQKCTMGNGTVKYAPEFTTGSVWKPVNPRKALFDSLETAKGAIETAHSRYLGDVVVTEETLSYIPQGAHNG